MSEEGQKKDRQRYIASVALGTMPVVRLRAVETSTVHH
jgi:hypothetical protein